MEHSLFSREAIFSLSLSFFTSSAACSLKKIPKVFSLPTLHNLQKQRADEEQILKNSNFTHFEFKSNAPAACLQLKKKKKTDEEEKVNSQSKTPIQLILNLS